MSNKISDKNVGSIEEDIEILERFKNNEMQRDKLERDNRCGGWKIGDIYKHLELNTAIAHLLNDYIRQKQINEEHQKINGELREKVKELDTKNDELLKDLYSANCIIADLTDSIPKQNIIEKIEELDRKEQELQNSISEEEREEYEDANISYLLCDIKIRREVLQELLQESEDK